MSEKETLTQRTSEVLRRNEIISGDVRIVAKTHVVNGDVILKGWPLPGGGFTESRKVAQQVADQLAGGVHSVSLKVLEQKRGIGGPYAIPFYV